MEGKRVIAVAGSHGKTTTTSLIAFILSEAGRQPMYLIGGESRDLGGTPPGVAGMSAWWRRTSTSEPSTPTSPTSP